MIMWPVEERGGTRSGLPLCQHKGDEQGVGFGHGADLLVMGSG